MQISKEICRVTNSMLDVHFVLRKRVRDTIKIGILKDDNRDIGLSLIDLRCW